MSNSWGAHLLNLPHAVRPLRPSRSDRSLPAGLAVLVPHLPSLCKAASKTLKGNFSPLVLPCAPPLGVAASLRSGRWDVGRSDEVQL